MIEKNELPPQSIDCPNCDHPQLLWCDEREPPLLCTNCGWMPDRWALTYLCETYDPLAENWTLVSNQEEELIFKAQWNGDDEWRFEVHHDPLVKDWQINAFKESEGFGLWDPGSVDTWTEAVAFLLDTLDVAEDSMVKPTEHYKT